MAGFDVILVLPYAFSDHPSFPEGILRRALEQAGFSTGVIERPSWQAKESFTALGRPRLCFAVVSGPVDSMVLNFTSLRKRRREDLYQPKGEAYFAGLPRSVSSRVRPDRALIVLANRLREAFKGVPVVIGGIEATMRRFTHFDFQEEGLRRSILLDSRADLLVVGMGEKQLVAVARRLAAGEALRDFLLPGTMRVLKQIPPSFSFLELPSHEDTPADPALLLEACRMTARAAREGKGLVQRVQDSYLVQAPLQEYTSADLDEVHGLPYGRCHSGGARGGAMSPALEMNLFSVTSHRGCSGGCTFCSLTGHQGLRVISRSAGSIAAEISRLASHPCWKGVVTDIGGPTADMYGSDCSIRGCRRDSCLAPSRCRSLRHGQAYLDLLRRCRSLPGVKKIFVGSGLRYDLLLECPELLEEIVRHHCGRFLRVAPEHTEEHVLARMGKPPFRVFEEFLKLYRSIVRGHGRPVDLALYLVVGHPGEGPGDVDMMKKKLRDSKLETFDVQVFTPTPGTLSTAMYASGLDAEGHTLEVERRVSELARRQRLLIER